MDISFFIVAFGVPLAGCGTLMAVAVIAHRWPMPDWLDNLMIAAVLLIGALYLAWLIASAGTHSYYTYYEDDNSITMTTSWASRAGGGTSVFKVSDDPEARRACAKEPEHILIRPFKDLFGGDHACFREPD